MTPQEKAKELFDKFAQYASLYSSFDVDKYCVMNDAKHCALIAVDEITSIKLLWYQKDTKELEYWREVKQEIQNL